MSTSKYKERVAKVMAFCRDQPEGTVTYHQVSYHFSVSVSTARDICKTAADISDCYEYDRGKLRYSGNKETFKSDWDPSKDAKEAEEEPENPISPGEALRVRNILLAKFVKNGLPDKEKVQWNEKRKRKWGPDELQVRTD